MPTPTKGPRLGGTPAHERLILANLASQLFEHGRIVTTEAKAKRLRPLAEKLITKAKRGDLHSRRQVMRVIKENGAHDIVHTLFTEIAPTFADRDGGYVRITKVGPRKGDNAPMAVIELVSESVEDGRAQRGGTATSRRRASADEDVVDGAEDAESDDAEADDTEDAEAEADDAETESEDEQGAEADAESEVGDTESSDTESGDTGPSGADEGKGNA